MAQRIHAGDTSDAAIAAHNSTHASLVNTGTQAHSDGPEYGEDATGSPLRTPILTVGGVSMPASPTEAAQFFLDLKAYLNLHLAYADEVSGEKWYAHKVVDAAHIITQTMGSWSSIEATMLEATRLLVNDICTRYEAHRLNTGGVWHTAVDTLNVIGTPVTFTSLYYTAQIGIERTNYVKALFNDHVMKEAGTHSAPDSGNVVATANALYSPTTGPGWTGWIALLTALRTAMIAHPPTVVHAISDNTNIVTAPVVAVPGGTYDLVNEELTDFNAHVASTTYHHISDAANQTALATVTTVTEMVTAAQQLYTSMRAHALAAPTSRALRKVA